MRARTYAVSAGACGIRHLPVTDEHAAATRAIGSVPGGCKPCLHSGESIVIMASRVPASLVPALAPALALALALALAPTLALALASSPSAPPDRPAGARDYSQIDNIGH